MTERRVEWEQTAIDSDETWNEAMFYDFTLRSGSRRLQITCVIDRWRGGLMTSRLHNAQITRKTGRSEGQRDREIE